MDDKLVGIIGLVLIAGSAMWFMGAEAKEIVSHVVIGISGLVTGAAIKK